MQLKTSSELQDYKKRFICILLGLLVAFFIYKSPYLQTSNGIQLRHSFLHGTLVVAVPYREGLVICADRRTHSKEKGDTDSTKKIIQLDDKSLFASTGTVGIVETATQNFIVTSQQEFFFVKEFVLEYFKDRKVETANWDKFKTYLELKVATYFARFKPLNLQDTTDPQGEVLFQVVFFNAVEKKKIQGALVKFNYRKQADKFTGEAMVETYEEGRFDQAFPLAYGNAEVILAALQGDNRFSDVMLNPIAKRFFANPLSLTVSQSEAQELATFLMSVSEKRVRQINPKANIGTTTDWALLLYKDGFKWL
jgi:hypothetical protein